MKRRDFTKSLAATVTTLAAPAIWTSPAFSATGLEKQIGSMMMVGFQASSLGHGQVKAIRSQIKAGLIGGVILLGYNIAGRKEIQALNNGLRSSAKNGLLISVDQEGGKVRRLKGNLGVSDMPSAAWISQNLSPKEAEKLFSKISAQMKELGFNVNLAPVVDLYRKGNPVIGKLGRAYGSDAATVADYAGAFVRGARGQGVAAVLKHFPGHGSSKTDSHNGFVDISQTWEAGELDVYDKLIRASLADMIMGGHLLHKDFGAQKEPITFSNTAMTTILRDRLHFTGVAMTDDLDMAAISNIANPKQAIIRAVQAGNDILMTTNSRKPNREIGRDAVGWISRAIKDGRIARQQIEQSAARIANLQKMVG